MVALSVWMNGERVGVWRVERHNVHVFRYDAAWVESPNGRPLSLSLPITATRELRGAAVESYFQNLLPDNDLILRRVQQRFGTRSTAAADLLAAIGRDCVGAVQILGEDETPAAPFAVRGTSLGEDELARLLHDATVPPGPGVLSDAGDFRISIAGAQEKTAFLWHNGSWLLPQASTPTTHIFKLPLGIVGGSRRLDLSTSVENEWLCLRILRALGFDVSNADIAQVGATKVLVVERFDRRWIGSGADAWLARLPQEDFCQATGTPPARKYEADGGPGIDAGVRLLDASDNAANDKRDFLLAQFAFWLMGATDGHAKNFSIRIEAGGRYAMTPLYDVISVWPVVGSGADRLMPQELRLAMAVRGRNVHYRMQEILPRHWLELGRRHGVADLGARLEALAHDLPTRLDGLITAVLRDFPAFPEAVAGAIADGMKRQARRFLEGLARVDQAR